MLSQSVELSIPQPPILLQVHAPVQDLAWIVYRELVPVRMVRKYRHLGLISNVWKYHKHEDSC